MTPEALIDVFREALAVIVTAVPIISMIIVLGLYSEGTL
jgi:hypothetical protein